MDRNKAIKMVEKQVSNKNLVKHMIAVGAIMKGLAKETKKDENLWEITGILHDIDYEKTKNDFKRHSLVSAEILDGKLPEKSIKAIKSHNFENTGVMPDSDMDWALICSDALSGLIVACALVMPNKKLSELKVESIEKKYDYDAFAKNVDRQHIDFCEKIGIKRKQFFEIALGSMMEVSKELGL